MRFALLVALLLGACSDPPPPPAEVTLVEEARPPEDPPSVEDPVETAPPDVPIALELPEEIPVPPQLPIQVRTHTDENESESSWPTVDHPVPEVRAIVNATIAGIAEEVRAFSPYGADCHASLAHEALISVACNGTYDTRGGVEVVALEVHLAIADGAVHPVDFADAFLPGTDVRALAHARCQAEQARLVAAATDEEERYMLEGRCGGYQLGFAPRGVAVVANDWRGGSSRYEIPYAELSDRIRADGPLAPVLSDRAPRFAVVTEQDATGWAVTEFGTETALVRRWMDSDPAATAGLLVDDFGGGLVRLVRADRDSEAARRVARALGAEASPLRLGDGSGRLGRLAWDDWDAVRVEREAVTLRWVRTTEDLNLRPRADDRETVLAVLPAGSLVAAVGGDLRRRGANVHVVTTLGPGSLASRHLRAHEGCVIGPGDDARHVAQVQVRERGAARDAWLVISRRDEGSHVALHALEGTECALGAEILGVDVERPALDVRLTGTTEHGGSTLLVVGTGRGREAPGEMRYRVWRVGSRGAVFDETFRGDPSDADAAVRTSETAAGAYFPLTIEPARAALRRFAWAEDRLTEQAPPP